MESFENKDNLEQEMNALTNEIAEKMKAIFSEREKENKDDALLKTMEAELESLREKQRSLQEKISSI